MSNELDIETFVDNLIKNEEFWKQGCFIEHKKGEECLFRAPSPNPEVDAGVPLLEEELITPMLDNLMNQEDIGSIYSPSSFSPLGDPLMGASQSGADRVLFYPTLVNQPAMDIFLSWDQPTTATTTETANTTSDASTETVITTSGATTATIDDTPFIYNRTRRNYDWGELVRLGKSKVPRMGGDLMCVDCGGQQSLKITILRKKTLIRCVNIECVNFGHVVFKI